mgnify:CR=1 FL=1
MTGAMVQATRRELRATQRRQAPRGEDDHRRVEGLTSALAQALFDIHGLEGWRVEWCDYIEGKAGWCWPTSRVITLSRHHLLEAKARNIRECLLHEIAHALVGDGDHDEEWWNKLLELGGDGIWVMKDGRVTFARPKPGEGVQA